MSPLGETAHRPDEVRGEAGGGDRDESRPGSLVNDPG